MFNLNDIAFGFVTFVAILLAGHCYVLGGLFEYLVYHYKDKPSAALKLFSVFDKYSRGLISVMYLHLQWETEETKLTQQFRYMVRRTGMLSIIFFGVVIVFFQAGIADFFLNANTTFDQINYGTWTLLSLLTILRLIQLSRRLIEVHSILKSKTVDATNDK